MSTTELLEKRARKNVLVPFAFLGDGQGLMGHEPPGSMSQNLLLNGSRRRSPNGSVSLPGLWEAKGARASAGVRAEMHFTFNGLGAFMTP